MSDEELMARVAAGDMASLGELFERYRQSLFGFVSRLLPDRGLAEDVVVEAFVRVHEHRHTFRGQARFSTWLYTIAHHLAIDKLRRARRETALLDDDPPPAADGGNLAQALGRRELARAVAAAIRALPPDQRAVIVLREYQGHSYAEIARIVGAREQAVRVRAHRARLALRRALAPYLEKDPPPSAR